MAVDCSCRAAGPGCRLHATPPRSARSAVLQQASRRERAQVAASARAGRGGRGGWARDGPARDGQAGLRAPGGRLRQRAAVRGPRDAGRGAAGRVQARRSRRSPGPGLLGGGSGRRAGGFRRSAAAARPACLAGGGVGRAGRCVTTGGSGVGHLKTVGWVCSRRHISRLCEWRVECPVLVWVANNVVQQFGRLEMRGPALMLHAARPSVSFAHPGRALQHVCAPESCCQ